MNSLSDAALSTFSSWLQWGAIWCALASALLAALLIMARSESTRRLTSRIVDAESTVSAGKIAAEKFKVRHQPRTITDEAKVKFKAVIDGANLKKGAIFVGFVSPGQETHRFAQIIKTLLAENGFGDGEDRPKSIVGTIIETGNNADIAICYRSRQFAPAYVGLIQHAFEEIGIKTSVIEVGDSYPILGDRAAIVVVDRTISAD